MEQDISVYGQMNFSLPHDVVPLPTGGIFYKNKKKSIKVGYLTATDENILLNATTNNKEGVKDRVMEEYANMDKGSRILAYRMLLEKFNSKYATLSDRQKLILKEFINNISNTTKLRDFVNTNFNTITEEIKKLIPSVADKTTQIKLAEVVTLLHPLDKTQNVKDENIVSLLQYYQLIEELKSAK